MTAHASFPALALPLDAAFLAMEAARRELAAGRRGRLICFNRFLGKRLAEDMPHVPELSVGTLHRQMLDIAKITAPDDASDTFWAEELPQFALEALVEAADEVQVDFLVIDEVQDLMTEPYLHVIDLMVKGGLKSGRILFFGDFERQAIYSEGDGRELMASRTGNLSTFKLTVNCRNLPRIGYAVNRFSGLEPGYQKFRRADDGFDVTWLKYRRGDDQSALLREAIEALREDSYDLREIVVLSPLGSESVAATTSDSWLRQVLRPADGTQPKRGELQYSSIYAFKGLEAPAVVVTDLDRDVFPNFASVLYTGLTRATDRLYGLMEEKTGLAALEGKL